MLRRYRIDKDTASEAEVIEHVRAQGFPAPRVDKADGRDLVMEQVTGPTMLAALLAGDIGAPAAAAILAELHERLHMIGPVHPGSDDTHVVVHFDLHPDNVIMAPTGPVLLDWTSATDGQAELDVAMSALILAQVAVHPGSELALPGDHCSRSSPDGSGQ
ncbi:phosphotransferase [Jiangella gansuensis]|uniref:phosphotransferase n=1 Tax=Jiangella gansuensis TaxID=281473 RepID=UPI0004B87BBA|nr:phosphotransferase [Jiangella gansuensis]